VGRLEIHGGVAHPQAVDRVNNDKRRQRSAPTRHKALHPRRGGLLPFGSEQRRDLLEIVEERCCRGAIIITSQIFIDRWHDIIGEPTIADAILLYRGVRSARPWDLQPLARGKRDPQYNIVSWALNSFGFALTTSCPEPGTTKASASVVLVEALAFRRGDQRSGTSELG
jgi:hypothetical protein